jgi:hypothetical protein
MPTRYASLLVTVASLLNGATTAGFAVWQGRISSLSARLPAAMSSKRLSHGSVKKPTRRAEHFPLSVGFLFALSCLVQWSTSYMPMHLLPRRLLSMEGCASSLSS